jgi:hypothetical protein
MCDTVEGDLGVEIEVAVLPIGLCALKSLDRNDLQGIQEVVLPITGRIFKPHTHWHFMSLAGGAVGIAVID